MDAAGRVEQMKHIFVLSLFVWGAAYVNDWSVNVDNFL